MVAARAHFTLILAAVSSTSVYADSLAADTCKSIRSAVSHPLGICWPDSLAGVMAVISLEVNSCKSVASNSSGVYWPGSDEYLTASSHWASSSSDHPVCTVEPGSPDDLATTLKILGANRVPFAIKSGGHTSNPSFSSTRGVQISLSRFSEVTYDDATSTVRVGSGLLWDQVYAALEPFSVNVVGGRMSGPGVGGFATGGGYSWKSNQYGLTMDTMTAYDLVLPNGTFIVVTEESYPDLFWGLKGSFNNFGIVTAFTMKVIPQDQVWGGFIIYTEDHLDAVSRATANFSANNTDPKASILSSYNFVSGSLSISLLLFYDAPLVANGVFDEFLAIEPFIKDISTRSYASLVKSIPFNATSPRTAFHTVSVLEFPQDLLNTIINETYFWGNNLQSSSLALLSYNVEPFHGVAKHATPAALPHDTPLFILNLYGAWTDATMDGKFIRAIKESVQRIYQKALSQGQDISIESGKQFRYPNYALWDTPLEQIYGRNVERLKQMRVQYDPDNVMSLTGGFRF